MFYFINRIDPVPYRGSEEWSAEFEGLEWFFHSPNQPRKSTQNANLASFGPIFMEFGMQVKNGRWSFNAEFQSAWTVLPSSTQPNNPSQNHPKRLFISYLDEIWHERQE